jgi:hypothetical protein
MTKLFNENYFYSVSGNVVNIVSLEENDESIISIDGMAAKLFVSLVEEKLEEEPILQKSFELDNDVFKKIKDDLISNLVDIGVFNKV